MIEYIIGIAVIGGCAYVSHLGQKKREAANERMRQFSEDCKILGNQLEIDLLARSYGLVVVPASSIEKVDRIDNKLSN